MNKSRPNHRKCRKCGIHVFERTLRDLAETAGRGGTYEQDMKVMCPSCGTEMVQKYQQVPDSADVFNPLSRDGISEDTIRETREAMFGTDRMQGLA